MGKPVVAIVRYEKPIESVRRAVELCGGLDHLPTGSRVFIKPNIVFWTRKVVFPKWGVITTSRMVEDAVVLLKEHGVDHITIGEGMISLFKDKETPAHAFESLGYERLKKRYGVKAINVFERKYREVDMGNRDTLKFNAEILDSKFSFILSKDICQFDISGFYGRCKFCIIMSVVHGIITFIDKY